MSYEITLQYVRSVNLLHIFKILFSQYTHGQLLLNFNKNHATALLKEFVLVSLYKV